MDPREPGVPRAHRTAIRRPVARCRRRVVVPRIAPGRSLSSPRGRTAHRARSPAVIAAWSYRASRPVARCHHRAVTLPTAPGRRDPGRQAGCGGSWVWGRRWWSGPLPVWESGVVGGWWVWGPPVVGRGRLPVSEPDVVDRARSWVWAPGMWGRLPAWGLGVVRGVGRGCGGRTWWVGAVCRCGGQALWVGGWSWVWEPDVVGGGGSWV
jgi:hypothetical protein